MEFLTTQILVGVTRTLTGKVLDFTGKKIKDSIIGTDKEKAIERCLNAAVIAICASATSQAPEDTSLLDDIFRKFFSDDNVANEASIFLAISKVTSFTFLRWVSGSISSTAIMSFDKVPLIDATKVPFFPLPFLLVRKVYNSPCDSDTSSILRYSPMFWGNII